MHMTADRASALWAGMVLAGVALLVAVWLAWPEPTTRLVRLPYGESAPKTPLVVKRAPAAAKPAAPAPVVADVSVSEPPEEEAEEGGVLALVERRPASAAGPRPEPSAEEALLLPQESPEQLGADPLPGAVSPSPLSQSPAPAAGEG